jgi:hypothetical protein
LQPLELCDRAAELRARLGEGEALLEGALRDAERDGRGPDRAKDVETACCSSN